MQQLVSEYINFVTTINDDQKVFKSIEYLNYNQNVVYYIEHLGPETCLKEMVPDCCKPDNEVEIPKANESDLHNLDGCTRLDAKESETDEELCTVSGKDS